MMQYENKKAPILQNQLIFHNKITQWPYMRWFIVAWTFLDRLFKNSLSEGSVMGSGVCWENGPDCRAGKILPYFFVLS